MGWESEKTEQKRWNGTKRQPISIILQPFADWVFSIKRNLVRQKPLVTSKKPQTSAMSWRCITSRKIIVGGWASTRTKSKPATGRRRPRRPAGAIGGPKSEKKEEELRVCRNSSFLTHLLCLVFVEDS